MNDAKEKCPVAEPYKAPLENTPTEAPIVVQQSADEKRIATLKAALALKGHAVYPSAEGGYLVCKWDFARFCEDADALERFALKVGAIKP